MKLFLHIGMGKTGTTSIQKALKTSGPQLAAQKVHYLGMWFDMVDPKFDGIQGFRDFVTQEPEDVTKGIARFVAHMKHVAETTGAEIFIHSNEDFFGHIVRLPPLLDALREAVDLRLILYVRDVHAWLPSAYTQWGIRHKVGEGRVQPFREKAAQLVANYLALKPWQEQYGDILTVRHHQTATDVVADFADTAGIALDPPAERTLERAEDAEVLLRAVFNSRFKGEVFPERFNKLVLNPGKDDVLNLDSAIDDYLDFTATDEIIAPHRALFEELEQKLGVPFLQGANKTQKRADADKLRARLLDYLLTVVLKQSVQINALERRLRDLED